MSKINYKNPFNEMIKLWIEAKELAIEMSNGDIYKSVLEDSIKKLSIIYSKGEKEWFLKKVADLIKIATGELKENMIKYNKLEVPF